MKSLAHLFENNRKWSSRIREAKPEFFPSLAAQQSPQYLWIGCSDSRVPANEIVGLLPGELFVHRNVANLVIHTDMNCLSVLQYAVDILAIRHVIVCGHYGCGGIKAAMEKGPHGLVDNWLRHVRDTYQQHRVELDAIPRGEERLRRLCEINVVEQVINVCNTTIVQAAWAGGRPVAVHGWIYGVEDGLLRNLDVYAASPEDLQRLQRNSCAS
jgi:carbonic anhydrase